MAFVEEGLPRLVAENAYWSEPASRVELVHENATSWLQSSGENSTEAVYLDPMFDEPIPHPVTDIFRLVADPAPLSSELLAAAIRAARRRVVYRVPHSLPTTQPGT